MGREDLPLPSWLFAWGAAVVLVVSFVALAALWPRPRLQHARERVVLRVPVALEVLAGALGVGIFAVGVYAGFAGVQTGTANLLPTLVYVALWVGVPVVSAFVGDLFAAISPWRAAARGAGWVAGRLGVAAPEPLAYPAWLGRWPAAVGLVAFAWLELAYTNRDDPSTLALLACAYAAVQLVGMALYGVEQWTRNADAFAVAFGLYARLAPLHWHDRELRVRPPLSGAPPLVARAGTVAVLAAMIGTTTFDGFSQGTLWLGGQGSPTGAATWLADRFASLGLGSEHALEAASTVGLVAVVLLVGGLFRLGIRGMRTVGEGHTEDELHARVRPHAHPHRAGLPRGALRVVAAVPGPGAGVPGLRPARRRLGPLRDVVVGDRLRPPRRDGDLVRAGRLARHRPPRRARPGPRPGARPLPAAGRRDAVAGLDAGRHGRLHVPRPLAPVGGGMSAVPLAHAGHWYHAVLYLAPVLVVVLALWISSVREKRAARRGGGRD